MNATDHARATRDADLRLIESFFRAALDNSLPPSFRSPDMGRLFEAIGRLTDPQAPNGASALGLTVAGLIVSRLKESMQAEHDAAYLIDGFRH
jgi:hypothetical protein